MDLNIYIKKLIAAKPKTKEDLTAAKRQIAKLNGGPILTDSEILKAYRQMVKNKTFKTNEIFARLLRKRAIRTMSGIAPVAVLTKPYACPGNCAFCPTEKEVPKSYLSNEPAVMRAIRCDYKPYDQVQYRLRALIANGHEPTKIELIVIGGTWSVLPIKYKYWYIWQCFKAANDFKEKNPESLTTKNKSSNAYSLTEFKDLLTKEQKRNETAKYQIIGLTLETRPDYINEKELIKMRTFGCTRVELGVQTVFDDILKLNRRGHDVQAIANATSLLRSFGFKITYHLMPGLPGSTPARDLKMFKMLFTDERFQPDQIKFYPTVVTRGSLLFKWWQAGKYKPYSDDQLEKLIIECKKIVPPYVRIIRLIRDIPGESIIAGNKITNLRQVMQQRGALCHCIRCREPKDQTSILNLSLSIVKYSANGGNEFFISFESKDAKTLFGFCRLWIPSHQTRLSHLLNVKGQISIVRELHVYGELVSVGQKKKVQHAGLGRKLMGEAEKIARKNNCQNIIVIAGVGVRNYYRKLGYGLKSSYMVKKLT